MRSVDEKENVQFERKGKMKTFNLKGNVVFSVMENVTAYVFAAC